MEGQVRVFIVNSNKSFIRDINNVFNCINKLKIVGFCLDGKTALAKIVQSHNEFDVILLCIVLSGLDGFDILDQMKQNGINTKVIIITYINNNNIILKLNEYNNVYRILFAPTIEKIENELLKINNDTYNQYKKEVENIPKLLHDLGMPCHIKGYHYLREGISVVCNHPDINGLITKDLYPYIANMYDTTSQGVERAMRRAIEVCWNRGDYDLIEKIFGQSIDYNRSKPTNSEFISMVAEEILTSGISL